MKRSLLDITQKISRKLGDPELTPKDLNHPTYSIWEAKGWRFVELLREIEYRAMQDRLRVIINTQYISANDYIVEQGSEGILIKFIKNNFEFELDDDDYISGRVVSRLIDAFDNTGFGTLTIYNVALDYGTEGASPENFEILVYGLHLPGHYTVKEVGNNVVITLLDNYIDYDSITINDIYVIGKLVDIPIATEDNFIITTEDGLDIIIK